MCEKDKKCCQVFKKFLVFPRSSHDYHCCAAYSLRDMRSQLLPPMLVHFGLRLHFREKTKGR